MADKIKIQEKWKIWTIFHSFICFGYGDLEGFLLRFKKASVAFNHQAFFSMECLYFCGSLALIIFALLFVCYGVKNAAYHFKAFKEDFTHQVKINFLSNYPYKYAYYHSVLEWILSLKKNRI